MPFPDPRKGLVRGVILALVLAALAAAYGCRGPRQPNVVLISIDTLRADKLGAYGHTAPTSPAVDRRLAAQGVTFTRAFSQSPKTTPSHMSMLTSLYPCVHGVELWTSSETPSAKLRPAIDTLAELLQASGYATVAFTGGGHVHASRGFADGFDTYEHGDELKRTLEWLRAHGRDGKFFLFFHTYLVHDPYVHPLRYIRQFDPDYNGPVLERVEQLNQRARGRHTRPVSEKKMSRAQAFWEVVDRNNPADVRFVEHLYEAGILRMDETQLTPLLDLLDELQLAENTLVVFTSDHGEAFLEHGNFLHMDLYGETLHVPLIVRYPGHVPAGARFDAPVTSLDLMPTILDIAGLPVPAAAQGRSLVPLWSGGKIAPLPTISEWNGRASGVPFSAVRDGGFSYIVEGSDEQLFDLGADPGERNSLVQQQAGQLAALRAQKAEWEKECRIRASQLGPPPSGAGPSEETRRQLRALGYVQ